MLFEESGIAPEVARERGYRTVKRRAELTEYPQWQRRLGLYIPTYSPDGGTTGCLLRPNRPRKESLKYEAPQGSSVILDVHPRAREEVCGGDGDLFIVEGVKKGDSLLSHGAEAVVSLLGVWMAHVPKSKPKKLLPCFDHVRLRGRRVHAIFDSDWRRNDNVHAAQEYLVGALEERGADVRVAYLEDKEDGAKVGADDYLVSGGTVAELKALCRRFERQDVARIRLSKDEKLKALACDLDRRFWATEWKGMAGASTRDVVLKLIEAAKRYGKPHPDGITFRKAQGPLALEAKVSTRTLWKCLNRMEEMGIGYRDNEGRKADKSGTFVLRASVSHEGKTPANEGKATSTLQAFGAGDLHLRAPRLMWSSPGSKRRRGTVEGTRKVRQSRPDEPRPAIKRLGKIRGAILDALDARGPGGTLTLQEIADSLHRRRVRDIRRRNLPMLEEAGILTVDDDVVALAEDWLSRLEDARDLGHEIEAGELARRRYEIKSRAYHNRDSEAYAIARSEASNPAASFASVEAIRGNREAREAGLADIALRDAAKPHVSDEQRKAAERIDKLVREGVSEEWARGAVIGSAALVDPPRKSPTSVPRVDGIYQHGQECDCEWCAA